VFLLRNIGIEVDYTSPLGMIAIAVGGITSALWGIVVSNKYKKIPISKVVKDGYVL
jgi:hypothetical protein